MSLLDTLWPAYDALASMERGEARTVCLQYLDRVFNLALDEYYTYWLEPVLVLADVNVHESHEICRTCGESKNRAACSKSPANANVNVHAANTRTPKCTI